MNILQQHVTWIVQRPDCNWIVLTVIVNLKLFTLAANASSGLVNNETYNSASNTGTLNYKFKTEQT